MPNREKTNEADIQFELYRLLRNNLNEYYSASIKYESVKPEFPVNNKAVDLVIDAEINNVALHFLAIEVKKPTIRSILLFREESVNQIDGYSKNLNSIFSILTDGNILRLFKKDKVLGNYRFYLNDNSIKRLLKELLELYAGKRLTLSFPTARAGNEKESTKERDGLTKMLIEVLEHLNKEKEFQLKFEEKKTMYMRYLNVGSFKKIFRLGIEIEKRDLLKDKSYVHLQLSDLRPKLGMETLNELLVKLKRIPGFNWVDPKAANRNIEFIWKSLKYFVFDGEPNFNVIKKQLLAWFFELFERLHETT